MDGRLSLKLDRLSYRMHLGGLALTTLLHVGCQLFPAADDEGLRSTLVGKAYLENREVQAALEAFRAAIEHDPGSSAALRNLARGHLLASEPEAAAQALERAAVLEVESAATSYLAGLAAVHQAQFGDAVLHFEAALRLDPQTAPLHFQLASAYQAAGRHEEAREELAETLRLDPLHTSSVYKLLGYARQARDEKEAERLHGELVRLRALLGEEGRTAEALEKCVYTLAEAPQVYRLAELEALPVHFVEATLEMLPKQARSAIAVAFLDIDNTGRPTLVTAETLSWGVLSPGADFASFPIEGLTESTFSIAVGDFFNRAPEEASYDPLRHARNDLLLLSPDGARLFLASIEGTWEDVTASSGLAELVGRRARWVDYEHDGDLDLIVTADEELSLWQNRGDGTFLRVTEEAGLSGLGSVVDVAAADLDGDVAVDLVLARGDLGTLVLHNLRTGEFAQRRDPPGPWPPARGVLLDDLDHDGRVDAALLGAEGVIIIPGSGAERSRLEAPGHDLSAMAFVDFDNDGWRDLVAGGGTGQLRLWHNSGAGDWRDATVAIGLEEMNLGSILDVLALDGDADGDTDLLIETEHGLRFLRNDGGNARAQLKVRLVGTKTNANGLGARLQAQRGRLRVHRSVTDLPIEIGLGSGEPLDVLRVLWSTGIVDNKLDVAVSREPFVLEEKNVAAGSCPFLYAWDGEGFRFVTDILGNAPLGLSIRRGVPLDADPDELVRVDGLAEHDGRYRLTVTEEMREVLYLDSARLVAVDHAPDIEVHATDKLAPAPYAPSEVWALGDLRPALRTASDDGVDRTSALSRIDYVFAPPGRPLPPPLRGLTRPLAIDLEFAALDPTRSWVLALTGWLQYGDASTNIAASQGTAQVVAPRLELETTAGRFEPLDVVVGMPAGKTKTILVDLAGKLGDGRRRLRLVTSFEIRWDRIVLGERLPSASVTHYAQQPSAARLYQRGFSEIRSRAKGHPTTPEFAAVSATPPWQMALEGWMTRYGDVQVLVAERDERLALVGAGDALELTFDAGALPALRAGRERTFFFYSVGWDKDGDLNVIRGDSVEPLPVAAKGDWPLRFNTRWVARHAFRD